MSESITYDLRKGLIELSTFFCESKCLLILFSNSLYSKLLIFKGFIVVKFTGDSIALNSSSLIDYILGEILGSCMILATLPTEILKGL